MKSVRAVFTKTGRARYISHLDLARCFARVFFRAQLPVWYTEGFNPHPYMTFALPLSLGVESRCETVDFRLTDDALPLEEALARLNAATPPGVSVLSMAPPVQKPEAIVAAEYSLLLPDDCGVTLAQLEGFFAQTAIPVIKKTKKRESELDLKPLIVLLSAANSDEGLRFCVRLPAGGELNVGLALLLGALWEYCGVALAPSGVSMERTAILNAEGKPFA